MTSCNICQGETPCAKVLPVCVDCLRTESKEIDPYILKAHSLRQPLFGLPPIPPRAKTGIGCKVCANNCCIPPEELGYCGLRRNQNQQLQSQVRANEALLHSYLDPHVTNCCGAFFCPGGTGAGYPQWAYRPGAERGYSNLAVFFYGCSLDCLFCQNASHKQLDRGKRITSEQFLTAVERNSRISCICYFGGSPEPQLPFTIKVMKECQKKFPNRILRQCFEMNGQGNPSLMQKMALLAAESGGIIKFDLKAYSESVYRALCGVSNQTIFDNFTKLADILPFGERDYPPLMATTLLVPYYVDAYEVKRVAEFIKELNQPSIEYSLLIFHPNHLMSDLPLTPLKQAQRCYDAAKEVLGKRPHVGNIGLLGGRLKL